MEVALVAIEQKRLLSVNELKLVNFGEWNASVYILGKCLTCGSHKIYTCPSSHHMDAESNKLRWDSKIRKILENIFNV